MTISDDERFLFDLQGFLLLPQVLTTAQCSGYLALLRKLEERCYDDSWIPYADRRLGEPSPTKDGALPRLRLNGLLRLDPQFDALIDHPGVLPYLEAFMAGPQLGNTWSICKGRTPSTPFLHRGVPSELYTNRHGVIRSAMLNVVWFLDDNGPNDGCMVVIPGSHKNGIDLHDWSKAEGTSRSGQAITGKRGDVLLMSESTLHDGLVKTTEGTRTNLYFNYIATNFNVMTFSPQHNRHFCMPAPIRSRFSARQRAMTNWMEYAQAVEVPAAVDQQHEVLPPHHPVS